MVDNERTTAYRVMVRMMNVEPLAHGPHMCTHAWHTVGVISVTTFSFDISLV